MNAWDWILLAAVLVGAGFALAHLLKSKKNGCCGNCHSCGGCCERKERNGRMLRRLPVFHGDWHSFAPGDIKYPRGWMLC